MNSKPIQDNVAGLVKSFIDIPVMLKKAETYCLAFSQQVLAHRTENFERVDSHFTADGLQATYMCNLDSRLYTVKITPSKG